MEQQDVTNSKAEHLKAHELFELQKGLKCQLN